MILHQINCIIENIRSGESLASPTKQGITLFQLIICNPRGITTEQGEDQPELCLSFLPDFKDWSFISCLIKYSNLLCHGEKLKKILFSLGLSMRCIAHDNR